MRDLIIIGGGAAGLSAAMYALSKQIDVLLIAKNIGGKAGWQRRIAGQHVGEPDPAEATVRLFADRLTAEVGHTMHDTVERVSKAEEGFVVETTQHGPLRALAVIVATGVTPVALDAPGAPDLVGYGLGYSTATHAHLLAGKTVAAIGTTSRLLRGVNELSRIAHKVYLISPVINGLMTPQGLAIQNRPNVEVLEHYQVRKIHGLFQVQAVDVTCDAITRHLEVDAVFVDLGLHPNSAAVRDLAHVDLSGFIHVDADGATSVPGLYAAGDVTDAIGEQILIAVGQGARAAVSAYDYLLNEPAYLRSDAVRLEA
ncbi:MAG TPA: NAD(P)/FAD-dependent oxidoreductase [Roseiflexaceae bacterium]|nr:NAD(P)/FAD-dependent oxidoreductase [Roseiflexaceae bacterium]